MILKGNRILEHDSRDGAWLCQVETRWISEHLLPRHRVCRRQVVTFFVTNMLMSFKTNISQGRRTEQQH